jgi:hypothetical protein
LSFEQEVRTSQAGLVCDLEPQSNVLLVAFGGIGGGFGRLPVFEFFNSASTFGVKKAFVRDLHRSWYHRGVPELGEGIDAVGAGLGRLIADSGVDRTVAVGNSAGGYAALLFGQLLDLSEVHAFSPQTFVDPDLRRELGEWRWQEPLDALYDSGRFDPRYGDLRMVMSDTGGSTPFYVYYDTDHSLDVVHAERLAEVDRVSLQTYDGAGHGTLVQALRDSGELQELLERALSAF